LLARNLKIKIYRIISVPVVLYGCETLSLTFREESTLRMFENMMLRIIFGHKRDEVTREWRKRHNEEINDLFSSSNILRVLKSRRMRELEHVWGRGETYIGFRCGNLKERDHLEDPGVVGRIILRWIFRNWDVGIQTRSSWLRIGTGGGHL